jgi:hypothetical protein
MFDVKASMLQPAIHPLPSVAMMAKSAAKSASVNSAGPDTLPRGAPMASMVDQAHPRAARPHPIDHERPAAGVDLRQAGVDQRFDAGNIEATGHAGVH